MILRIQNEAAKTNNEVTRGQHRKIIIDDDHLIIILYGDY